MFLFLLIDFEEGKLHTSLEANINLDEYQLLARVCTRAFSLSYSVVHRFKYPVQFGMTI